MICKKCRKDISENEKFCSNCGKKVGSILNIGGILAILCIIIPTILIFIYGIATIFPSDFDKTLDEKKLLDFFEIKNCNILNEQEITPNDKIKTYYKTSKNSCLYEMNYVASDDNKLKASLRKNFLNKLNQNNNVTDKLSNHSSSGYVVDMSDGDNYNILIANQKFVLYLSTDTDNKQDIQNLLLDLGLKSNDKKYNLYF